MRPVMRPVMGRVMGRVMRQVPSPVPTARRMTVALVAGAALVLAVGVPTGPSILTGDAASAGGVALSAAAWNDSEWAHGRAGVLDCGSSGNIAARGAGQFVSGGLLPVALGDAVDVNAVTVTNDGTASSVQPASTPSLGDDAYANPLAVTALNGPGLDLTNILVLPLETGVGAVEEYGQARPTGESVGATGLVNSSGGIALDEVPSTPSQWATIKLSRAVSTATGGAISSLVAGISDAVLTLGAVSSSAAFDGCAAEFTHDTAANLDRQYLVAGMASTAQSPLVGTVVTGADSGVNSLESTVNGLATNSALKNAVASRVNALVTPVLGLLAIGSTTVTLSATSNFGPVDALLDDTITDSEGLVSVSMANSTASVDLARLLGGANGLNGLNGLNPNTELVVNDAAINRLTAALGQALDGWSSRVLAAVNQAIGAISVTSTVKVVLRATAINTNVATVTATTTNASLSSLLAGTTVMTATVSDVVSAGVLGSLVNGLTCAALGLCGLTTASITAVANSVATLLQNPTTGAGAIVGQTVSGALTPSVTTLGTTLATTTAPVVSAVSVFYGRLFGSWQSGLNGLFSLGVNLQNAPETGTFPAPNDWTTGADAVPAGQFDVAAFRLGVLGALGVSTDVNLDLARSSVGTAVPPG